MSSAPLDANAAFRAGQQAVAAGRLEEARAHFRAAAFHGLFERHLVALAAERGGQGNPKNKLLMRLMENPEWRKLLDKTETEMNSDFQKVELFRLKEQLYYVIDERQHQADLTEIGRTRLRPDNPDAFMLPDLATEFSDLDKDASMTPERREERKLVSQQRYADVSEEIHAIDAAVSGHGVVLASRHLVADLLASGQLTQLSDITLPGLSYWAVFLPTHPDTDQLERLLGWLRRQS